MKKYRIIRILAALLFSACLLAGCTKAPNAEKGGSAGAKKSIVVTIFPEYDWVMNILGDKASEADVTMLLDSGVDLHSYQPTAMDMAKISGCDIFMYVGGESDEWAKDALASSINKDMQVLNLLEILGDKVKEEEIKEGMEHDHEHVDGEHENEDGDEDHDHEHHHEEDEIEYDEHVWLSLKNTSVICEAIESALEKIDPENKDIYKANCEEYKQKLSDLDSRYSETVSAGETKTLLFGDRFPFRYLIDDYGLDYYAAFVGCSAESEASFETIVFLSGKMDELGLKHVMTIESSDGKIADTIIQNTGSKEQDILVLDSMQSVTSNDVKNGETYLGVMEKNLEVLKKALN